MKHPALVWLMFYVFLAACGGLVALIAWKIAHPLPLGL